MWFILNVRTLKHILIGASMRVANKEVGRNDLKREPQTRFSDLGDLFPPLLSFVSIYRYLWPQSCLLTCWPATITCSVSVLHFQQNLWIWNPVKGKLTTEKMINTIDLIIFKCLFKRYRKRVELMLTVMTWWFIRKWFVAGAEGPEARDGDGGQTRTWSRTRHWDSWIKDKTFH